MNNLNDMQKEAVNTVNGPVLILAGAGSGKTTVLINRIDNMIANCGIAPWNILAITFTNKAAKEIKTRLENTVGISAMDINTGTFHSICLRILRRNYERIGYKSGFAIYDTADQQTLVKECIKELNINDKDFPPKTIISVISGAKDKMILPEMFEKQVVGDFRLQKIAQVYKLYQKKLKQYNAFDFDDLIMQTVLLLENNNDVLQYYQDRFKYIMVDEYQDTSHCQYRLVYNLAKKHRNICVVGDDDQSIYKFRGADITNILEFEKQFDDTKVIKLEQNYRSTQPILDAANEVIKNNKGRKSKKLWTENTNGAKINTYTGHNEREEAYFVVKEINKLVAQGYSYKDIAILFRMNAQSRVIEEAFMSNSVPYRLLSGTKFYDRKEIKDIIAYLRLISNNTDDISLMRIINEPKRAIGKTTVDRVKTIAVANTVSMYDVLKNAAEFPELSSAAPKLVTFVDMIKSLTNLKATTPVNEILALMLEKSGYISMIQKENTVEAKTRIENIKEFSSLVMEFEKTVDGGTLEEFLEGVALVSDIDNYDQNLDSVVVMTLHSAKGLEFPVVFLTGMEDGIFPSERAIFESGEIEEERRLCYVGITRAKKLLYLVNAKSRTIFGMTRPANTSRFISEISQELLNNMSQTERKSTAVIETENVFKLHSKNNYEVKPKNNINFSVGERVTHSKFGAGTILAVTTMGSDAKLSIAFDSIGTKNLMASFAKLDKVTEE